MSLVYVENCQVSLVVAVLIGFGTIYAVFFLWKQSKRPKNGNLIQLCDLPSPKGYPILGHLPLMGNLPHVVFAKWSEEFGSLYRIKMGFKDVLIVSGIKTIRTALLKHSVAFAGRPNLETMQMREFDLAFSDYSLRWAHEKGIATAAVRLYTTGKDPTRRFVMETGSFKHANNLVDQLLEARQENSDIDPKTYILVHVTNAICEVCFGKAFELTNPEFKKIFVLYEDFDAAFGVSQTADFWPLLKAGLHEP